MLSLFWKRRHPSSSIHPDLVAQIQWLLTRSHQPRVQVLPSQIPQAGSGVYATQSLLAGQVACLYPGSFTPPLPQPIPTGSAEYTYLAGQWTPSGVHPQQNAYLLNLKDVGGYLDGLATVSHPGSQKTKTLSPSLPAEDNPSACGHMVNHNPGRHANVKVVSFFWKNVLDCDEELPRMTEQSMKDRYSLPNQMRSDKFPWYYDPIDDKVVYGNDVSCGNEENVCGAAMIVQKPIPIGDELYLDYELQQPYPDWAKDWYFHNISIS